MSDSNKKPFINKPQNKGAFDKELRSIYQNRRGELPDMSRLDFSRRSRFRNTLIIVLVCAAIASIASWTGFLWYGNKPTFSGEKISLSVNTPFSAKSGDAIEYSFSVVNDETVSLEHPKLIATFPDSFIYAESSENTQKTETSVSKFSNVYSWERPAMFTGEKWNVTVKGQLIGEVGLKPSVTVRLRYSPENYSSTFEKSAHSSFEITNSLVSLTTQYNHQISKETPGDITAIVKNLSETQTLRSPKMVFDSPDSFKIDAIETEDAPHPEDVTKIGMPALSEENKQRLKENGEIQLPQMPPHTQIAVKIHGSFSLEQNGVVPVTIRIMAPDASGSYVKLSEEKVEFEVVTAEMLVTMSVNGLAENSSINFGDTVKFSIKAKNKSASAIGGVSLRTVIDSPVLDWNTLISDTKYTLGDDQILWTEKEIPKLSVLLPEDEAEVNFTIKTKPFSAVSGLAQDKYPIKSFAEAVTTKIDTLESQKTIESNSLITSFNSNTQLQSFGRYFDEKGVAVGAGPIPPVVNQKTTYQISWTISNSFHELNDVALRASLPAGVSWEFENSAETGSIIRDNDSVIWTVNRMPTSVATLTATFKVSILPTLKDLNTVLTLLGEAHLTATDKETKQTIKLTAPSITTNLTADTHANNKGLVQPANQ